jgi:hypothetical protein|tara:strand:+ start:527 stop:1192 length:666 start_codon:yes stop_codon:yes gene_type:complete
MPVTINGSGSITGISAGGLPDGCIVDADINGMSSSKLSGALPAISGAALTGVSSGLKHISTTSITSTSSDIIISNAFNEYPIYRIYLVHVRCTSSNRVLYMRARDSGGDMTSLHRSRASHALGSNFTDADACRLNNNSAGDSLTQIDMFVELNITGFAASKTLRYQGLTSYQQDDADPEGDFINGCCYRSEAVVGLKFFWSGGSFSGSTDGKIMLFGVNNG